MEKTFLQVRTEMKDKEQASVILEEQVAEVNASMAMEQMPLDVEDIKLLRKYQKTEDKEMVRQQIIENYKEVLNE